MIDRDDTYSFKSKSIRRKKDRESSKKESLETMKERVTKGLVGLTIAAATTFGIIDANSEWIVPNAHIMHRYPSTGEDPDLLEYTIGTNNVPKLTSFDGIAYNQKGKEISFTSEYLRDKEVILLGKGKYVFPHITHILPKESRNHTSYKK